MNSRWQPVSSKLISDVFVLSLYSSSDLGLTLSANGLLKVEGCELEGVGRQDLKEGSELRRDFFLD